MHRRIWKPAFARTSAFAEAMATRRRAASALRSWVTWPASRRLGRHCPPSRCRASAWHFSRDAKSVALLRLCVRRAGRTPTRAAWAAPSVARDDERVPSFARATAGIFAEAKNGGADRAQTGDLLVANEALYQLSYCPEGETAHLGRCVRASKSLFRPDAARPAPDRGRRRPPREDWPCGATGCPPKLARHLQWEALADRPDAG